MARKKNRSTSRRTSRASARSRVTLREEFKPDYTYVIHDLRRIALLAGSFVAILVVLAFVLR